MSEYEHIEFGTKLSIRFL